MKKIELNNIITKIKSSLNEKYDDINVVLVEYQDDSGLTETQLKHSYYKDAYVGMITNSISIEWNKFYDKIANNGTIYGSNELFVFDTKTGIVTNSEQNLHLDEEVDHFISEMLKGEYKV